MSTAGLSLSLSNALSGLNVNQQALAILSQNIANANTPNYSRQKINQQSIYLDGQGAGVSLATVTRQVDAYLVKAVQLQNSSVGANNVIDDYNARIQLLLGKPGSQNSIDSFVNNFFTAMQALAQTPQDSNLQQAAVNSGVSLAGQIQQLAQGLQGLQFQADQDISSDIAIVNNDLKNVAQLNIAISNATAIGQSVADMQDQRDALIKDISQYINVQTFARQDGSVNLTTSNGIPLLDSNQYELAYSGVGSAASFNSNTNLSPITVVSLDNQGNPTGTSVQLVSGGLPADVTSSLTGGTIQGLLNIRDQQIPNMMNQLDTLAAGLRDQVNTVNNAGTGYPGSNSFTGTRLVNPQDDTAWSGSARIAVLNSTGQSVSSPYADEPNGMQPMLLDLGSLDTGNGPGNPSVQGIINAINQYYGVPQNKAEVGNLNNIQLASDSATLPGTPPQFSFDFNLNNISSTSANFYVTGVSVQDDSSTSMTPVTSTIPTVALSATNTYVTTASSGVVTVNTTGTNNLTDGETVYLTTPPGGPYNGIPAADLGGFFTVSNVTASGFDITAKNGDVADPGVQAPINVSGMTLTPPYTTVDPGGQTRTGSNGLVTASLANNSLSLFYTVTVDVAVDDGQGNISQSQITYRINNKQNALMNTMFGAQSVTGDGSLVQPTSTQPVATAMLVDANGNELPKIDGQYITTNNGYLEIKANNSNNVIAIDSMNSAEEGFPDNNPPIAGTGWGFSHYFDLNDFFQSNQPIGSGDTTAGSALNMAVEQRLLDNSSLLSTGNLAQSPASVDPTAPPNFTYVRNIGDNSVIQKMSGLGVNTVAFAAAGGLGATSQTFSGYAGQIIGAAAIIASNASTNKTNAQTLLDGFTQRASSISGVNLDTELANTVIYQNAYAASARVITVANTLFDALLQAFA